MVARARPSSNVVCRKVAEHQQGYGSLCEKNRETKSLQSSSSSFLSLSLARPLRQENKKRNLGAPPPPSVVVLHHALLRQRERRLPLPHARVLHHLCQPLLALALAQVDARGGRVRQHVPADGLARVGDDWICLGDWWFGSVWSLFACVWIVYHVRGLICE